MTVKDPWHNLRQFTDARIGLGRSGSAMPTQEVLEFSLAHAMARDAVTSALDWNDIEKSLEGLGLTTLRVRSAADERSTYLRRPDLGRQLSPASRQAVVHAGEHLSPKPDLVIVVGDGLSSKAVSANIAPFLGVLIPSIKKIGWSVGPVVLAHNARVALGDEAGELLAAKAVIVLIGERPGLSSPDSLGAYLTWAPRTGLKDADRNCISNIRVRGLSYDEAAFKLTWLLQQAFTRQLTGVALKDEADYGTYLASSRAKQIT